MDIKVYNQDGSLKAHYYVMELNRSTIFSEAIDRIPELQSRVSGTYGFSLEDPTSKW